MHGAMLLDIEGPVATITFDRPEILNAQSVEWTEDFHEVLDELEAHGEIRAAVITGNGRAFCAGGDVDHPTFTLDGIENRRPRVADGYRLFRRIRAVPFPFVAAVNGPAVGSGMTVAAACAIRIAARSAYFQLAFVDVGVVPDQGASFLLPQLIGQGPALHMGLTGERIGAERALSWGLVTEVVDDSAVVARAREIAELIARKPPLAVRTIKADMTELPLRSFDEAMTTEAEHLNYLIGTDDCREAIAAFKEKRPPTFHGK